MKIRNLICVQCLTMMAILFAIPPAAAKTADLLEMSEQLDQLDKQDFQEAIERATSCTKSRDFKCAESALTKASKSANSGKDKKVLLASRDGLTNEKQQLANEIKRAEEARQARIRKEEEDRRAEEVREARRERQRREAEAEESSNAFNAMFASEMQRIGNENAVIMENVNRQTAAAYEQVNRRNSPPGSRTASQVIREAEAKQKYESSVSESSSESSGSSSSSSSSSSGSASGKASTSNIIQIKRYEYVTEGQYRAVRTTKEEGCAAAKNAQPNKVDIKRIISTGACTCKVEASNTYGTFYACVIPFKAEISTTNNPNPGVRTPSSGVSR